MRRKEVRQMVRVMWVGIVLLSLVMTARPVTAQTPPPVCEDDDVGRILSHVLRAIQEFAAAGRVVPRPQTASEWATQALAYEDADRFFYEEIAPDLPACIDGQLAFEVMGSLLDSTLVRSIATALAGYEESSGATTLATSHSEMAATAMTDSLEFRDELDDLLGWLIASEQSTDWPAACQEADLAQAAPLVDFVDKLVLPLPGDNPDLIASPDPALVLYLWQAQRDLKALGDELPACIEVRAETRALDRTLTDLILVLLFQSLADQTGAAGDDDLAGRLYDVAEARFERLAEMEASDAPEGPEPTVTPAALD
jgi:hypothetical protein